MGAPLPDPGWYADPAGGGQRFWDGYTWTQHRAAPAPQPPAVFVVNQAPLKSAAVAGLLQLFFGFFGAGRFYIGHTGVGAAQLVLGLIGMFGMVFLFAGLVILLPLSIWCIVDAIIMFTHGTNDSDGRRLA